MSRIIAPSEREPVVALATPPTIAVVIPAYQAAATIGETIASVLAQEPSAHEVVVADDGSTDDLGRALSPFGSDVRHLRLDHRGVAAARNAGARAATAEFVLIADADDILLPGKLAALGQLARRRPDLDLLCTDMYFEIDGRRAGRFMEANTFVTEDQRVAIMRSCFVGSPAVRRSTLLAAGGFDETLRSAVDWECWIRLILGGAVAGLVDEPLLVYRLHGASLTADRARALRERIVALERGAARADLDDRERAALDAAIEEHRSRALLAEAQRSVSHRAPDARRRCIAVARHARTLDPRVRLRALAAAAAPSRSQRKLLLSDGVPSLLDRAVPQRDVAV